MRLLQRNDTSEFSLTKDFVGDDTIPPYAILSHTWEDGQEVTFEDLIDGTGQNKTGYNKIQFCGQQAKRDGLQYFWIDTCCIDKSNQVVLQNAINSMFRWYQNAVQCYVYLSDVSTGKREASSEVSEFAWEQAFRESKWFTRGWTLQELLAPRSAKFFSHEGEQLGDKTTLERKIHDITGITIRALQGIPLCEFGIEERFSWARNRQTTYKEDKAYSLLGMFGIYMSLNYGEGEDNAFERLRRKINKAQKRDGSPHSLDLAAKLLEQELVEELEEYDPGELSWRNIVERWERNGRCRNCGSKHWERNCRERCGKCLYPGHTASWCEYPVRCKECNKQGHLAKDCLYKRLFR